MKDLYLTNVDFRTYVDKYCRCYHKKLEVALQEQIVIEYANYIKGRK